MPLYLLCCFRVHLEIQFENVFMTINCKGFAINHDYLQKQERFSALIFMVSGLFKSPTPSINNSVALSHIGFKCC